MSSGIYIGVDGGATKTVAVVTDRNERILGEGKAGPSNYRIAGPLAAAREIRAAIASALRAARYSLRDIAGSCFGLSGVDADKENREVRAAINRILPKAVTRRLAIFNDVFIGYASGTHEAIGAAVIAGTGSNAVAFGPHGNTQRASGLGHILSDDGSAYDMAVRALRAATRSYDQRGPQTVLERLITRHFGVRRMRETTPFINDPSVTKTDIASLSPIVDEAANAGDRVARTILMDIADELALMATTVIREANISRRTFPIVLIGSVFNVRRILLPRFKRAVRQSAPRAVFIRPAVPFAVGAARLAIARFD